MATDISKLQAILKGYDPYGAYDGYTGGYAGIITQNLAGGASSGVGAQQLQGMQNTGADMLKLAQDYLKEQGATLTAVNPLFDPNNYLANSAQMVASAAGGGAESNRQNAVALPYMQAYDILKAVEKAKKAADTYKSTGQVVTPQESYAAEVPRLQYGLSSTSIGKSITADSLINFKPDDATMQSANAAAARVGANLPFKQAGIGAIAAGGVFSNAQDAQKAYTNGQLNDFGTNIVTSNSAANNPAASKNVQALSPMAQQIKTQLDSGMGANGQPLSDVQKQGLMQQFSQASGQQYVAGAAGTTGTPGAANAVPGAGGTSGATGATGAAAGASGAVDPKTGQPMGDPQSQAAAMSVLNKYLNDGTIDSGTYQFFKKAVETWNPGTDVDYANILNTFETLKQSDIDPYFQEQSRIFIDSLQTNFQQTKAQRDIELQQEQQGTKANTEAAQQDLANRGMLFSGQAVKTLGTDSPFAQTGSAAAQQSPLPTVDFAGLPQGTVQMQNQAATSSSALRYANTLKDLSRNAEQTLGTEKSGGLIPGVEQMGNITGTLTGQQKQAQASALSSLYDQANVNTAANKPINLIQ